MTHSSARPEVVVATARADVASGLAQHLREARVHHVTDAESLLRDTRASCPDVVLLCMDLESGVPHSDLLAMLRARADLAHTRWLAMGTQGLGPLLQAGADALVAEGTPPAALATLVRTHVQRVRQLRELEDQRRAVQKRLDDALHQERVRDQLTHMLVHDLKNPISAVLGLIDVVVEDGERVPGDLTDLLKLARDESHHLLHLAVNILDVRKMQAGKMHLNSVPLLERNFRDIIALSLVDVGIGASERRVHIEIPAGLGAVVADAEVLRRVFANLLSNAVKHTARGGNIRVVVRQQGSSVECAVQDDGEGIPAEDIPNLFTAFEQSRLTLHSRFDTGMGLAFCKMAIDQHGGRIWVESRRGQGSTFTFALPVLHDEEEDIVELLQ